MNKLFIIGNGFDLAHGLKTSYSDFLLGCLQKYLNPGIYKTSETNGCLMNIEVNKLYGPIKSISDFVNSIHNGSIKITCHHFLYELIRESGSSDKKWVDIEYSYYQHLLNIYKRVEKSSRPNMKEIENDMKSLNSCLLLIKKELKEYLGTLKKVDPIDSIRNRFDNELTSLNYFPENRAILLIFNYTETINLYSHVIPKNCKIIFIHGTIDNAIDELIFGYGDYSDRYYSEIEQLNSDVFLDNFKNFQYLRSSNYQSLHDFINGGEHKDDYDVHVMGHSCGVSDRLLLKSIFESKHCKSIKLYHYKKPDDSDDFTEKTKNVSRNFSINLKADMMRKIVPFSPFDVL